MKKNIRYRPSKASAAMSIVVGVLFIIIGVTLVLPATLSSGFLPIGLFGLVWTGMAVVITITNVHYLLGKKTDSAFYGGFEITEEEESPSPSPGREPHDHIPSTALNAKARLEQLESLKEAGLLSREEYEAKRKEILEGL